ncbi:hypothetical protein COR50_09895 [Chitinophaga caeni]|uniref:Uncharacterized protein n=1 Tax=Chitinophaga caeni TaxID=2029983 RepID=A0A291QU67_9BACT|nr:hypothetical protein [Chitinophaga caeni]ATL47461.1 hypothetical protein COR50_09895 [Chitinophaga caeni]
MLKLYEYLDEVISMRQVQFDKEPLEYYASDIIRLLGYGDVNAIKQAMFRAMEACVALHYPVNLHFKKTYCWKDGEMLTDWQMSMLGCYFLVINCDPSNPNVAKAQLLIGLQGGKMPRKK